MAYQDFSGSKIALLYGEELLTYQRDAFDHIPFPGLWDLPGGGRENNESPEECALRELYEEFELTLPEDRIIWKRRYVSLQEDGKDSYFFVANITKPEIKSIKFGNEGQRWKMTHLSSFLEDKKAIPHLVKRLSDYMANKP